MKKKILVIASDENLEAKLLCAALKDKGAELDSYQVVLLKSSIKDYSASKYLVGYPLDIPLADRMLGPRSLSGLYDNVFLGKGSESEVSSKEVTMTMRLHVIDQSGFAEKSIASAYFHTHPARLLLKKPLSSFLDLSFSSRRVFDFKSVEIKTHSKTVSFDQGQKITYDHLVIFPECQSCYVDDGRVRLELNMYAEFPYYTEIEGFRLVKDKAGPQYDILSDATSFFKLPVGSDVLMGAFRKEYFRVTSPDYFEAQSTDYISRLLKREPGFINCVSQTVDRVKYVSFRPSFLNNDMVSIGSSPGQYSGNSYYGVLKYSDDLGNYLISLFGNSDSLRATYIEVFEVGQSESVINSLTSPEVEFVKMLREEGCNDAELRSAFSGKLSSLGANPSYFDMLGIGTKDMTYLRRLSVGVKSKIKAGLAFI